MAEDFRTSALDSFGGAGSWFCVDHVDYKPILVDEMSAITMCLIIGP